ncbi:hypothetical protein SUS17_1801 [Sphingomonas sp. S17]|jgi:hypothetical protein|uniref:DNA, contig: SP630 n=1 Tax=Sphingomonas paucimobilis NBRC 13935 TaxID=1219050 RepID=A0A0C9NCJ7_SPHPI|nr:hypothetical protein [Sphingomonas paucimobilis]EGI55433.1 hypothetical protein SUS17_1801 [Sphingomonas sp. S17]GAN14027.1 hypothetical protein SP6_30_01680 [Sphingomonas paucimobilis NBRC 13935]MDG5971308.1 hypothetical protein [Sphingomonas paucimobilis]QPS15883.1 hypothetical protein I6G65_16525 [Sphingomonas paucimobilis]SUJ09778.1 Uncharacterised protein [Sphingomonas paucimobilis]
MVGQETKGWDAVRLTEARQVLALMGVDRDEWPPATLSVIAHYDALRAANRRSAALDYLAHALPRLEAIGWAARVVSDAARRDPPPPRRRHALDVALRWLDAPSEEHRRAAGDAADVIPRPVPERLLASAVFFSGGSIAAPGQPAVPPPEHVPARYVAGAIDATCRQASDPAAAFTAALALGEAVAAQGLAAFDR